MKRKFPENWVYPTRLSSFSEILLIRDLLFSASSFERDHNELNIPRKDDGDAYSKMETLKNHLTYMSINTNAAKFVKKALYKNNAPVVYLFVLRRLARKCTKIYNACRAIVRLIKPFALR